ncbi:hypothetical protein OUZ56_016792 [Daphnia magna]|uniref:Uncharacterized protein n=1 Tax=Daphnia magna TaxID=35525 RepID=A0ABR0ARP9_9CRUS|nr:hypothetical protein OUZ56_016792 [Daphnia magna]
MNSKSTVRFCLADILVTESEDMPTLMNKFVNELTTSIFTEEYLKTHKKSSKGGKPGFIPRAVMNQKHLEKI